MACIMVNHTGMMIDMNRINNWLWPYYDEVNDSKANEEARELAELACSHHWVNVSFNHVKIECYYCGQEKPEQKDNK